MKYGMRKLEVSSHHHQGSQLLRLFNTKRHRYRIMFLVRKRSPKMFSVSLLSLHAFHALFMKPKLNRCGASSELLRNIVTQHPPKQLK